MFEYTKKLKTYFICIFIIVVMLIFSVTVLFFHDKNKWGKHEYLSVETINIGSKDITRTKILLDRLKCEPWLITANNSKTDILSDNTIPEYATVYWKNKENNQTFTRRNKRVRPLFLLTPLFLML